MPKEEWGVKRICPTTGKRFYDLNKNPIVSPYTGDVVELDTGNKSRTMIADKPDAQKTREEALAENADELEEDANLDLGDDVLDDEDEDDNVSLDDIADVPGDDDES